MHGWNLLSIEFDQFPKVVIKLTLFSSIAGQKSPVSSLPPQDSTKWQGTLEQPFYSTVTDRLVGVSIGSLLENQHQDSPIASHGSNVRQGVYPSSFLTATCLSCLVRSSCIARLKYLQSQSKKMLPTQIYVATHVSDNVRLTRGAIYIQYYNSSIHNLTAKNDDASTKLTQNLPDLCYMVLTACDEIQTLP